MFSCTVVTDFPAGFTVFVNDDPDLRFTLDLMIPSVWVPEILCIIFTLLSWNFSWGMDVATSEFNDINEEILV